MRVSQLLLPTVKEDPAGAEAVSHKLMVRAGLVRQLAAGIYVFLPAGWRVMQKIEQIIREEMDAIGCQEMLMPVLQPAELWQESGRWDAIGEEMFRLKDRKRTDMALAMTHEEVVTWLAAREVHSYKQLPQLWYHFQTKERDEARPKSGILRTREFIMKDSYSLDVSEEALQESYRLHIGAYDRIYRRCGLGFMMVEGDSGMMGGEISHEYMAFADAGEDEIVFCRECGYASNVETPSPAPTPSRRRASSRRRARPTRRSRRPPARRSTCSPRRSSTRPAAGPSSRSPRTSACRRARSSRRSWSCPRAGERPAPLAAGDAASGPVMVLVRGDHELNELKLESALGGRSAWRRPRRSSRPRASSPASSAPCPRRCPCMPTKCCAWATTSPAPTRPASTAAA